MNNLNEEFVQGVYSAIVEGGVTFYSEIFRRPDGDNTIEYWRDARKLFREFDEAQQNVFFSILKQVEIDTIANIFAVFDGIRGLDGSVEWLAKVYLNGIDTNEDLSDDFLRYVEMIELGDS